MNLIGKHDSRVGCSFYEHKNDYTSFNRYTMNTNTSELQPAIQNHSQHPPFQLPLSPLEFLPTTNTLAAEFVAKFPGFMQTMLFVCFRSFSARLALPKRFDFISNLFASIFGSDSSFPRSLKLCLKTWKIVSLYSFRVSFLRRVEILNQHDTERNVCSSIYVAVCEASPLKTSLKSD